MRKAIFLDRDGTINVDKNYVCKVKDFEFIPRAIKALSLLSQIEYELIIITSQSGIGRGYYSEEEMHKVNNYMLTKLAKRGIKISKIYCCPHAPENGCDCRKPKTRMLRKAAKDFDLELKKCIVIGDKTPDIKMGENAKCNTILVLTGKAGKDRGYEVKPDFIAKDLYEAALYILKIQNSAK